MAIDVGEAAADRVGNFAAVNYTIIAKGNPANGRGTITSVEIWCAVSLEGCIVGTFYTTNGNTLKCRDSATIGAVPSGSKQTFTEDSGGTPLAIAVETGDFIGVYYTAGAIDRDTTGGAGYWYLDGQYIDPNDEATYTLSSDRVISLYGTGEEAPGWSGKVSGVTNPAKIMGVDATNIAKVKGV